MIGFKSLLDVLAMKDSSEIGVPDPICRVLFKADTRIWRTVSLLISKPPPLIT